MMRRVVGVIILMTLLMMSVFPVMAKNQLQIDTVEVNKDLENVGVSETVFINFSNNVVNLSVRDHNMSCFSMVDEDGNEVDFIVFMGDDQVDRDIKRIVEIRPESQWVPGTIYTITISGEMMAKNETALSEDATITFKTEGEKPSNISQVAVLGIVGLVSVLIVGGAAFGYSKRK